MKTVKNSKSDLSHLAIHTTVNPEFINGKPGFKSSDLEYLGKLSVLTSALDGALGNRLTIPYFDLHDLRIDFIPTDGPLALTPEAIVEGILLTAKELEINSKKQNSLELSKAVTNYFYVRILQAISKLKANVVFESSNGSIKIPILNEKNFTGREKEATKLMGSLSISGLFRSDDNEIGHGLYLTDDRIFVRLPVNDPNWEWSKIHDVLDFSSLLEGGIFKDKKSGGEWRPCPNSRIMRQEKIRYKD